MEPTSDADAASPDTPDEVAPMSRATEVTTARTAGMAVAAAVLSDDPAASDVWYWMVVASALMNWAEAL